MTLPDPEQAERLLVENLGWVERVAASLSRRHGLDPEQAEDFASWVKLRLVEDDYAILRKFRGDSAITTYLTVVTAMLMRDYRAQMWGRWRPSAAAERRGALAIRLETLVYRDGYSFDQAVQVIRTSGGTDVGERELAALFAELPTRQPLRPRESGADALATLPAAASAEELVDRSEAETEKQRLDDVLTRALAELETQDRVILRMRFWHNLSVAEISRGLDLPQKPLYRRIERSLGELRHHLESYGVSYREAAAIFGEWSR